MVHILLVLTLLPVISVLDLSFIAFWAFWGYAVYKLFQFRMNLQQVGYLPGMRVAAAPISTIGSLLPTSRLNPGLGWQWEWRDYVYKRYRSETISVVPFLFGRPSLYTSSLEVAKQVLSANAPFEKAPDVTQFARLLYGPSIFAVNGVEWRRHRKIMGPSFSHDTYAMVWEETASLYREMGFEEGWDSKTVIEAPCINQLTNKFSLIIIARCGFGHERPWKSSPSETDALSYGDALQIVTETCIERLIIPRWMFRLPIARLSRIEKAHEIVVGLMKTLLEERKKKPMEETDSPAAPRCDVASLMIQANEADGKFHMSDEELIGNTFFLLFAGHETMAHIWAATIGFLALYQDIQEELVKEIRDLEAAQVSLTYSNHAKFNKVLACFLESGRLFPPGFILMRDSTDDVVINTRDSSGPNRLFIKRGTRVSIDMVGLHYNPRYFSDPEDYRPSRWYDVPESELSIFSVGPRACIGRKFALTEACSFLVNLLREWRIEIILQPNETGEQWRKRVMKSETKMTMGVGEIPVRLVRHE